MKDYTTCLRGDYAVGRKRRPAEYFTDHRRCYYTSVLSECIVALFSSAVLMRFASKHGTQVINSDRSTQRRYFPSAVLRHAGLFTSLPLDPAYMSRQQLVAAAAAIKRGLFI